MIDPNVMRDAAKYLRHRYCEPDRTCLQILYEFRRKVGDDGTLIVVHKLYKEGKWGQPKSFSYEELIQFAEKWNNEQESKTKT